VCVCVCCVVCCVCVCVCVCVWVFFKNFFFLVFLLHVYAWNKTFFKIEESHLSQKRKKVFFVPIALDSSLNPQKGQ
jgi:hypothetical protein